MKNISVIVPVYQVEPYLNRCVDSVLSQTYSDFELLLVDDGSPDGCGEICDEYLLADDRVITFHQPNGGLSAARNTGIDWSFACSNSDWLTFIDSDDWVHEQYLELLLSACQNKMTQISVCDSRRTSGFCILPIDKDAIVDVTDINGFYAYSYLPIFAWGKLYSKKLFSNVRYPDGRTSEDWFTTHQLVFQCSKIAIIQTILYYYYNNTNSITGARWTLSRLDSVDGRRVFLDFCERFSFENARKYAIVEYVNGLADSIINIRKYYSKTNRKNIEKRLIIELKQLYPLFNAINSPMKKENDFYLEALQLSGYRIEKNLKHLKKGLYYIMKRLFHN